MSGKSSKNNENSPPPPTYEQAIKESLEESIENHDKETQQQQPFNPSTLSSVAGSSQDTGPSSNSTSSRQPNHHHHHHHPTVIHGESNTKNNNTCPAPPTYHHDGHMEETTPLLANHQISSQYPNNYHQHQYQPQQLLPVAHVSATGQAIPCQLEDGLVFVPVRVPLNMYCPYDNQVVKTEIRHKSGYLAWTTSLLLWVFCWPCFLVPFCSNNCKDVHHICPACKKTLAIVPATVTQQN